MTPRIIGTKKSRSTQAAERFFKERGITYQLQDIAKDGVSAGELDGVAERSSGFEELIDLESKLYTQRGMQYMEYDAREELLENPLLLRVPIIRTDKGVAIQPTTAELEKLI